LAVTLPWYLLTYYWTGNPVLPMMNGIFKSPLWEPENRVMDANAYGIGTSPGALLRLPFNLTWNTVRFGVATPRGAAGIALLLAIPFGFALLRKRRSAAIVFTAALLYFLLWAFSFQNIRYYAHFLPMLCVLGVATVLHFSHHRLAGSINRVCLAGLLVFQFSATPMQFWNIPERFPIAAAFGLETRQDLLRRSLRSYAAAERLNAEVKPGERVLGMDVEDARFYLKAPLETLKDSTRISVLRPASSLSGESLLHTLRQSGFAYIFATHESMKEPAVWYPYLKREFLEDFAIPIFSDDYAVVYRLAM
jgi:hypothetical protein